MAPRWLAGPVLLLALCVGCGNGSSSDGPPFGTGGTAGTGGAGGAPWVPACMTNALCAACPVERLCESDGDCDVGHICIETGCRTNEGVPIKQCALAPAGACNDDQDCLEDRQCVSVPGEGKRCVKTTPGCASSFDCVLGFSCEEGACVDRRVPCFLDADCPKSHFCHGVDASRFCRRTHVACDIEFDCADIAPRCEDIDGDGEKECAGVFDPNTASPDACVNALCGGEQPVCEVGFESGFTACGQYGLCTDADDCAAGFDCVGLWPDGRSECVPEGGTCAHIADCPARQVCASARNGGPPTCQGGAQAM